MAQLQQVGHDDIRPVLAQPLGLPDAVDPDHAGKTTRPPCRHTGQRVLEDRRLPWGDA